MKCYYCYLFVLLLAAVIDQVFTDEAATQTHDREKRQGHRGFRGSQHRPGEGQDRRTADDRRRPESSDRDTDGFVGDQPVVQNRFTETQSSGLGGLGLTLNLGGGGVRPQAMTNPANMGFQAAQNAASLGGGMGGFGGMPNLGGFGAPQNAAAFGFQAAQNAANGGNVAAHNPSLINIGGGQNTGLINIGGQPLGGHQTRPGNNQLGNQGNNRPTGQQNGRPGHQNGRPTSESSFVNEGIGSQSGGQLGGRPGQQNGRPTGENSFVNEGTGGQLSGRPGQQSGRPGQQTGRPIDESSFVSEGTGGQLSGRPSTGQSGSNGRPSNGQNFGQNGNQGQTGSNGIPGGSLDGQYSGSNVHQGQSGTNGRPGGSSNNQNSGQTGHQGQNQGNGGGGGGNGNGNKKCRGNQYKCQNRECVAGRNARCNGVTECSDGSDELDCFYGSGDRPGGQDTSTDRTTAATFGGLTTASPSTGCILPEQPKGGSFELGSCEQPCNIVAGTRVPLSSYLTYRCDEGYTLHGNNVSFCHGGSWYLPPTCVKTCAPLKSNSVDITCKLHGDIVSCESAIAPGTKATLACKHSYKIPLTEDPAYRELTCLEEGIWDRALFRCLPECGTAVAHGNTLIVNGFTAKLGVFPWHVGIYERNSAGKFDQICAGTLISPDLVVSAAHCFYDDTINEVSDASRYAVGAGKHYRLYAMPEKYAQKSLVKKIDVASRYYGASGNFAEDISLVRLETAFTLSTLVRPICMDWDNTYEREQLQSGQTGKAVGWGKTAEGVPSEELQEINLPYIPYQECVSAVPDEFKGYVTADKFCAGYLNGSSLCEGDSGGGLCFQLNGLWYLRGIVSVSPVSENTCDNNYYTAFTNVGRFREWIRAAYVSTS